MMIRRLTPVAVLLAAVLVMGAGIAKAEKVRMVVPSNFHIGFEADDFIVVTGVVNGTRDFSSGCTLYGFSDDHPVVKVVVVDAENPPAASITDEAVLQTSLKPGTRLVNIELVGSCSDAGTTFNIYEGIIASPQNFDIALVITPDGVTLTGDHEGVVGGGTDEFGIADAVCVKKGSQSIKTPILSDITLKAGDRLTGFVEIDDDPISGETTYACWLEY